MPNLNLRFRPQHIHGVYGINYYFKNSDGSDNRLQFEAEVRYCGEYLDDHIIYHLSKNEFVVDGSESNEYLYEIAQKCASVIYPIAVLVDKTGKIVYVRPPDRGKEWVEMRTELDRYYKGPTAEAYLDKVESLLNSTNLYNKMVYADLFFSQLFSLHYRNNNADSEFHRKIEYEPFTFPLNITFKQEIGINDDTVNYFNIYHKGKTETEYKYGVIHQEPGINSKLYNSGVSATLNINYELDKESFLMDTIEGDYSVTVDGEPYSHTRMEAYRLYEKTIEQGEDKEFQNMEKKHLKNENSFWKKWNRFF